MIYLVAAVAAALLFHIVLTRTILAALPRRRRQTLSPYADVLVTLRRLQSPHRRSP